MADVIKTYPTFRQALGLMAVLLCVTIITALIPELIASQFDIKLPKSNPVYSDIQYLVICLVVIRYGLKRKRKTEAASTTLSFKKVGLGVMLLIAIASFLELILEEPLFSILPKMPEKIAATFQEIQTLSIYSIFSTVFAAPICEEIIFRGIILDSFLKRYHTPAAITLSALIFAAIHGNIWQGTGAFTSGILLGWVYHKTRTLIPCIFIHALNNLLAILSTTYYGNITTSIQETLGKPLYVLILSVSATSFIAIIYFLNKIFKSSEINFTDQSLQSV